MKSTGKKLTTVFFLAAVIGLLLALSGSALAVAAPGDALWADSTVPDAPAGSHFHDVAVDSSGNIYAVGYITGDSQFNFGGSGQVAGGFDGGNAVIVKYDSAGDALWAKSTVTAPGRSQFDEVSVDSSGNIYAVGYISGDQQYTNYDFGGTAQVAGGYDTGQNAVIVKYDSAGTAQWAKSTAVGAPSRSGFNGVSADSSGNIYAVGYITGDTQFNFGGSSDPVVGGFDAGDNAVIVEYEPTVGDALWAKSTAEGGPDFSGFSSATVDSSGNIYAVGFIIGISEYDFGGSSNPVAGGYDGFGEGYNAVIVKYEPTVGNALWAKSTETGAPADSYYNHVSADSFGNIYAVGRITGSTEFGSTYDFGGSSDPVTGGYNDGYNAVIVKYDPSGLAQWASSTAAGAPGASSFRCVSADSSGSVYAVGYIKGVFDEEDPPNSIPYDFGGDSDPVAGGYVDLADSYNAIIVKYNSAGTAQWARSTVAESEESAFYGVSVDLSSGSIYAIGDIFGTAQVGFGNDVSVGGGYADYFNAVIVKYAGDTPVTPVTPVNPVTPELPYTGGQPTSLASTGQPIWLSLTLLAGLASIVSGFVLTRKRAGEPD